MAALILVQAAIGMVVNLYVSIPADQPGAKPAGVVTGSWRSFSWALNESPAGLAAHAGFGLIVALSAIVFAAATTLMHRRRASIAAWSAAALVLAAAASGIAFLNTGGESCYSLLMAIFAFSAIGGYLTILSAPSAGGATVGG